MSHRSGGGIVVADDDQDFEARVPLLQQATNSPTEDPFFVACGDE
jgi:hypothetical protein